MPFVIGMVRVHHSASKPQLTTTYEIENFSDEVVTIARGAAAPGELRPASFGLVQPRCDFVDVCSGTIHCAYDEITMISPRTLVPENVVVANCRGLGCHLRAVAEGRGRLFLPRQSCGQPPI